MTTEFSHSPRLEVAQRMRDADRKLSPAPYTLDTMQAQPPLRLLALGQYVHSLKDYYSLTDTVCRWWRGTWIVNNHYTKTLDAEYKQEAWTSS